MAGGNFMHRVMSYLVNELVVNSLANRWFDDVVDGGLKLLSLTIGTDSVPDCPAFQRFAVRTSRRIEDISNKAVQKRQELAEQMKDVSKNFESYKNQ